MTATSIVEIALTNNAQIPDGRVAILLKGYSRKGENTSISEVRISDGENFEVALKRFNRKIQQDGILGKARQRHSSW
jgi:Ribosomal protein S21